MSILKVKCKPVEKEAIRFIKETVEECKAFCKGGMHYSHMRGDYYIITLEGNMYLTEGDYIIKGIKGECYPCKPDIFEKTYDIIL